MSNADRDSHIADAEETATNAADVHRSYNDRQRSNASITDGRLPVVQIQPVWNLPSMLRSHAGNGAGEINSQPLPASSLERMIMKKILSLTISLTSTIWCCAQDYTYSTNLFFALAYPTNIYIGTNGTDPGGDSFHVWACKINHNTTLLWNNQQSFNWALTNFFATNQPATGLTTNLQFVDAVVIGGVLTGTRTNTQCFTNGLLQGITSP